MEVKPTELKDTAPMMAHPDFKVRFKAEYLQLFLRTRGLAVMVAQMKAGTLPFKPKCDEKVLGRQLAAMAIYMSVLEERARIEGIDLTNLDITEYDLGIGGTDGSAE